MIAPVLPDDDSDSDYKVFTAEEARQLRLKNPSVSPWRVIAVQVLTGILASVAGWAWTGRGSVGWSVAYGALAVVVPAALFARGMMGRFASLNLATSAIAFFLWELVKIAVSVTLLALAPRMVPGLSWLAMLVGLVLTMKVYWVVLLLRPKNSKH